MMPAPFRRVVLRATVYRSPLGVRELGPGDDLDGEDVVPGFRCRLGEIFE